MALFATASPQPNHRQHHHHRPHRQPDDLGHLHRLCRNMAVHPLPVKLVFIAMSTSDRGQPMAVYACPFSGCNYREGWVHDFRTGHPKRLWAGFHNGR